MHIAFLGLGSNLGDRESNIRSALEALEKRGSARVVKVSAFRETAPVGYVDQPDFLNAVAKVETDLCPEDLLRAVLDVEQELGRVRTIRWGPRVIDIDILLYDELSVSIAGLTIPHPEMMRRAFVLEPLAEIEPELVLPGGITAREAASAGLGDED
jgi:2-amino-4-hydroxy-6-hydroxymethyldihydropteridine diphosphokinase